MPRAIGFASCRRAAAPRWRLHWSAR
jgi:hypothetical protein